MISAVKSSLSTRAMNIEVLFDPVPNLDEVSIGTPNNLRFRKEVAANLKVPDYACNRLHLIPIDSIVTTPNEHYFVPP